ncbi:MAG: ABC transporter ATP-binding protein/permease [Chloroflexota bacterium]|nr:ABC transporter ATP-binding protein/permease [Chloroflexota bacterium]
MNVPLSRYWRLLAAYLRPQWPRMVVMAVLLVLSIALQLLAPQVLRSFLDAAVAGAALPALSTTALLFIALAVATQVVAVAETYVAEGVGWSATNALRADVALHCLRLDASFHNARTPGELIERIDGDVTILANFFSRFVIYVVGNALLLIGVLLLLAREDWRIGLTSGVLALAVLLAMLRLFARARPLWAAERQAQAMFYGSLNEHLAGTEDVRANGATAYVERRFTERLREWLPLFLKATLAEQMVWMVALSLFAVANAVALGIGTQLLSAGSITIGTVYLIFRYVELLSDPVGEIQSQIQNFQQAAAGIGRIEALLATTSRIVDAGKLPLPPGALAVRFDRVTFRYPASQLSENRLLADRLPARAQGSDALANGQQSPREGPAMAGEGPAALQDVTLRLEPGQVLGLLGRTGSGKTTMARMLARLYDPTAGAVLLGGRDVREAGLADVRRRVGPVTQEVQLFRATVRQNLTFFDPDASDERLRGAIETLGLADWLASLPDGLETPLVAGGSSLSGGEAQLLAFVRVFLKDPGLVILDEAASRLDPATEGLIEQAVAGLLRGRTVILIAHRLASVQRADEIAVLEGGRLVEHGRRETLAADARSRFAHLLRSGQTGQKGILA